MGAAAAVGDHGVVACEAESLAKSRFQPKADIVRDGQSLLAAHEPGGRCISCTIGTAHIGGDMSNRDILETLNLGAAVAENDEHLANYFVPTGALSDFVGDRYDVIRG